MIRNFIFSEEGFNFLKEYNQKFNCGFRIEAVSGDDVVFDVDEKTFQVPHDENIEDFKAAVVESLETGENILAERYKNTPVEYNDDVDY